MSILDYMAIGVLGTIYLALSSFFLFMFFIVPIKMFGILRGVLFSLSMGAVSAVILWAVIRVATL